MNNTNKTRIFLAGVFFTVIAGLATAAGGLNVSDPDTVTQNVMAPGLPGSCVYASVTDNGTGYFNQDLDNDGTADNNEKYIFSNKSRWEFSVYSGTGTANCFLVDESNVDYVGDPDNAYDMTQIQMRPDSGVSQGNGFWISDSKHEVVFFDRLATRNQTATQGTYSGACTNPASASYARGGTGSVYKGCRYHDGGSDDCSEDGGITHTSQASNPCIESPTSVQVYNTGFLVVCNGTASLTLSACEKL